ncbi:MAG: NAD(P)/FAD-dependent oxidoreductase [Deinococcales bacterium]|nr:NAD(P)/FAD-dependent oxidoreductase [Chitinophagaceae bacterium]
MHKKLVVIGGGAAGFFCAVNAARQNPELEVIIIEKNNKVLSKVKVSGGGRCNVTHACFNIDELILKYPRGKYFLKKTFNLFSTTDTITWFNERGVTLKTEVDNRMFPTSNNSQTIVDCLLAEAKKYKVKIIMSCAIVSIASINNEFKLLTADGTFIPTNYLCVACGGFSKTEQFNWLTSLGHSIETPVPSLFTFNIPNNKITELMGVSVENVTIKIAGTKFKNNGPLLITHWGLSGPAVLKLSSWAARFLATANYQFTAIINWLGEMTEIELKDQFLAYRLSLAAQKLSTKNPFGLPNRLWLYLLQLSGITEETRWADLPSAFQYRLIHYLVLQEFVVNGKTTFKEEFVTSGGIKLSEIDPNTMESKKLKNLFFSGEILDVDGVTGGFNFQHAWTSGWIAAKTIAEKSKPVNAF